MTVDLKGHREERLPMHRSLSVESIKSKKTSNVFRSAEERVLDHEQDCQSEKKPLGYRKEWPCVDNAPVVGRQRDDGSV